MKTLFPGGIDGVSCAFHLRNSSSVVLWCSTSNAPSFFRVIVSNHGCCRFFMRQSLKNAIKGLVEGQGSLKSQDYPRYSGGRSELDLE
jgi:hypothetical protein